MLQIDIRTLSDGVHEMDFVPRAEELGIDEDAFSDIHLQVRLDMGSKRILVQFSVSAEASLICDRTTVRFKQGIDGKHVVVFVPPHEIGPESEDESLLPLETSAQEIDLTDIIRDTLLLAVPIRKIAPGAEDEDIPTAFGAPTESDVDPRWQALNKLKSRSK